MINLKAIKFNNDGLIPVVTQSVDTNEVLMLAYMNEEALLKTIQEKMAYYYSRSRNQLWKKGETSGHYQIVKSLAYDCDGDSLLMRVEQIGVACHTQKMSCFHNPIVENDVAQTQNESVLDEIYATIKERKLNPLEGSYTNYLLTKGIDKILKKVGEETAEIIIAAKNPGNAELTYEISDLVYHMLVLMVEKDLDLLSIKKELKARQQKK